MNTLQHGVMVAVLAGGALVASAGQYWWSGNGTTLGGSGTWDTNSITHWGAGVAGPFDQAWPNTGDHEAVFTNVSGTVTLSGTIKASGLTLYTNNWTVTGGLLDFGSSEGKINLPNIPPSGGRVQATIDTPLSGAGGLTISSIGAASGNGYGFKLQGNNSGLTGRLEVQVPVGRVCDVFATNDFNFGAVPSVYTPDALKFTGGSLNINGGSLAIAANRGMTINATTLTFYQAGPYILNSRVTGSGSLAVNAASLNSTTVTLNQTNDFAGDLFLTGVKAIMGVHNALPHGAGKGNVKFNYGGTLDLNGYNLTVNGFTKVNLGQAVVCNTHASPVTLTVGDNNSTATLEGAITNGASSGALSVEKIGTGTITLQNSTYSTTANAYSGTTTVRSGTLVFDRLNKTTESLDGAVTLAGGTLSVNGAGPTTNASQTFTHGTLALQAGGDGITVNNRGGNTTLTVGSTWTCTNGASLLVSLLGTGTSTLSSSPTLTNGIVGGYAFVKDSTATDFATVSGGNVVRYTGATLLDSSVAASDLDGNVNYYMTAGQTLSGASTTQTVHSVRVKNAVLTLTGKVLVVGSGGIIFENTALNGIGNAAGNGTVTAPAGSDLVIYMTSGNNNNRMFSNISDNNGTVSLVIAGGSGSTLRLNGTSYTYSGDTVINGGGLYGLKIPYDSGKGNLVINSGGTADMAASDARVNGLSASPGNAGGTLNNTYSGTATNTLTIGYGDVSATFPGNILKGTTRTVTLIKIGSGTQTLSGNNTYNGGTILSNGVLSVSSTNNIGGGYARVTFAGGALRITGTAFTSFGATPVTVAGDVGLDIADAGNAFTFTNDVPGTLTKSGEGTLTVSGMIASLVTDSRARVGGSGSVADWTLKSLTGGAYTPAGVEAVTGTLTLEGGYTFDLNADGSGDELTATGAVTMNSIVVTISDPANLTDPSKVYTLVQGSSLSGTASLDPACVLPQNWRLKEEGNALVLRYVAPGTMIRVF